MFGKKKENKKGVEMKGKDLYINPPSSISAKRVEARLERLKLFIEQNKDKFTKKPRKLKLYQKEIKACELRLKLLKGDY